MSDARQFDVVVIGGGQAGLAVGYHLARQQRNFVILDAHARVGDAWRTRWEGLRLFTPGRFNSLPGMPFPGDPHGVPDQGRGRRLPRGLRDHVRAPRADGRARHRRLAGG